MEIILNDLTGQEANIGVGVKDDFLLLISHGPACPPSIVLRRTGQMAGRFTLIITDFFYNIQVF